MMQPIDREEWRWAAKCALVVLLLVAAPYALALLHPPNGYALARTIYYGTDLSQYLAAMGDGAASSSWLISDHLTSEPHSPALMYPFYVLMGKVGALLRLPPVALFALAMVLAVPALVVASYALASTVASSAGTRRTGVLFVLFASGLGVWVAAAGTIDVTVQQAAPVFAYDRAEVSTYLLPFGPPHLTLALALIMVWGRSLALWSWGGSAGNLAVLVLGAAGVALLNPFSLATMMALASGYALVRWISARRFPAREATAAVLVVLAAAPMLVANLLTFAEDPFWSVTYGAQNTTGSPAPWVLALDFGVLLPLAAAGAVYPKVRSEGRAFLFLWVLGLLALMYLPVPFQRRFGFGIQPALALLAGLGAIYLDDVVTRKNRSFFWRTGLRTSIGVGLVSGTMLGFALLLMASQGVGPLGAAIFEPRGSITAADWLSNHSGDGDVVLASVEGGNYLAGRIRGRVVAGHKAGTLDAPAKENLVRRFFDSATSPQERWSLAASQRTTFVFVGERERLLGARPLRAEDGFRLVYNTEGVQIYRMETPPM